MYTTADAEVTLSVYPDINDSSVAGCYDSAGTYLGPANVTSYYGGTTHHHFHTAAAGRSAGAYRMRAPARRRAPTTSTAAGS